MFLSLKQLRALRGPSVWAGCPVLEATLDLSEAGPWSAAQIRQTLDRLRADFPGTPLGPAADGEAPPICLAQAFGLTALRLQDGTGHPVSFSGVRPTSRPGLFLAAVEFVQEAVGRAAAETAWRLLQVAREGRALSLPDEQRRLRELADEQFPAHPRGGRGRASTWVIHQAARARGIPAARLSPDCQGCLRLGQGSKQHRCRAAEPDTVNAVARIASTDKHLAKQLLQAAGVPVPAGRVVATAEEAWAAACAVGLPVAIKPLDCDIGCGVSLDLRTREQVLAAFGHAHAQSPSVLVERLAPGLGYRVLVVGDRVAAVTRIDPPQVVGDGVATVAELVDRANRDPQRGPEGSRAPLRTLSVDEGTLTAQGFTPASVPPAGTRVLVRRNPPYFRHGGTLADRTDHIHPRTAAHAVAAAQALQIPVAGLDVVAVDISRLLEEQGGVVVEVNVSPALWLHLAPWVERSRPVGEDIVALLFPPGHDGRIPVAALVGAAAGVATSHLTALLGCAGRRVGTAGEREIALGTRRWPVPAGSPQERAGRLLQNTTIDVALLETSPRELVRAGFGNDRCDVALLLDSRPAEAPPDEAGADDDLGPRPGDFVRALEHALAPQGVLVLVVEEESAGNETRLPAERVILVAGRADLPRVRRHLAGGGRALVVQGEAVTLAQGTAPRLVLGKSPGGLKEEEMHGLLAALAAGLVLGLNTAALTNWLDALSSCRLPATHPAKTRTSD